jgi:hypothetical protein
LVGEPELTAFRRKKVSAPKQVTWITALILAIVGLLGALVEIQVISGLAFSIVLVGRALMVLATYIVHL